MSEKSPWQLWKEKNPGDKARVWDLFNPKIDDVPTEIFDYRYDLCKSCPFYINLTHQCKKCGCFLVAKVQFVGQDCPIGKWEKYVDKEQSS